MSSATSPAVAVLADYREPGLPLAERPLPAARRRRRSLLGLALGLAALALSSLLGLLIASTIYGYPLGGLG